MGVSDSYVYFAFTGDSFDPDEVTRALNIEPTCTWTRSDFTSSGMPRKYAFWQWATARGTEPIWIDQLVEEVVELLESKTSIIVELKDLYKLESTLSVILYVDINYEESTPALGHDLRVINFLYRTQTNTDVDIYRYDSRGE